MKKKTLLTIIITLILLLTGFITYYIFTKQDSNTLTILEKQWIDNNKNKLIDIAIQNDLSIFSYDGEGLIYEFLEDLEKNTELGFNKIPYTKDEQTKYTIRMVDKKDKNDVLIYEDNYALVTKENKKYNSLKSINNLKIGVLADKMQEVDYYLKGNNLSYTSYSDNEKLISAVTSGEVDGIVIPKSTYLKDILSNKLTIAYNITEMSNDLVITLGDEAKLNNILTKYFKKWAKDNYLKSFNLNLSNNYYEYSNVENDIQVNFKSKRYKYGFVSNIPYDDLIDHRLVGLNSEVIKEFSKLTGIEVTYTEYKSNAELIKGLNKNEIDFFFNTTSNKKYDLDVVTMPSMEDSNIVVLSHIDNNIIVNSVSSLKDNKVYTIANSAIDKYLTDNKVETKNYNNLSQLLSKMSKNSIVVVDEVTYEMYKNTKFKDYKIDYNFNLDNSYTYVSRDIKENRLFNNYLSFYITFMNTKDISNKINYKVFERANKLAFVKPVLFTVFAIIGLLVITLIIKKINEKVKDKTGVAKEDKLKYIDMLTSLKNRNYLNDSIEKWDSAEVYPQSIIIVDLNNVAYINDNYGHSEGDNVIKEAANILIKNQLEQTEIIRTNGNEFLIYLVGYEEKQIVTYIRKLSKEFKELEHGFGAALGYSMINDGIKTVDDAINEATLDMKTNKEEAQE